MVQNKTVTYSLSVDTVSKINKLCDVTHRSKSKLIEYAIEELFKKENM